MTRAPRQIIPYGAHPAQILDLYRPAGTAAAPLVLFVHGGGWRFGSRNSGLAIAEPLRDHGFATASVDYRVLPDCTVEDSVQDVAAAARWLLDRAAEHGLAPSGVALIGHSSGGHLVALLAADPLHARAAGLDPSFLKAVVTLDGVFNITRPIYNRVFPTLDLAQRTALSPLTHAAGLPVPLAACLIHGDEEPRFGNEAAAFAAAARAHGHPVTLTSLPNLRHGALVSQFRNPDLPILARTLDCLRAAFPA